MDESSPVRKTNCQHDVSIPNSYHSDYDFTQLQFPETLAKEYQFSLDAFQRQSVKCIEKNENVLVAAHTSAGKTAVAEYAIATALRNKQRVIYTSPIKALSNQKYRELEAEFKDVGLLTGDNTIDKNASCLVMTTEILRSMLYRGSEVVREVSWVIFDEVHYMRDKDRGVVWEEAIILVPENVRFVFLSATIPNAREFSEWIAHLKGHPCHTIYTNTRPVPLRHFMTPFGGEQSILVSDERGDFIMSNFDKAMAQVDGMNASKQGQGGAMLRRRGRSSTGGKGTKADIFRVIEGIKESNKHPVIVFSFSRRDCEAYAMQISKTDFSNEEERECIKKIFESAIMSLNEEDQTLPQITAILPVLMRGIGIHHSGLLPIIKEVVELMFHEGLIKCLFATETFAMGVNMPARSVLFTNVRKFDGSGYRVLTSGEYTQMSGRAGRRGIDETGTAMMMVDEKMSADIVKAMMTGSAEPLLSTFRLGYNMLLNLMRAEEADPEYVIARSFAQFQGDRAVPKIEESVAKLETLAAGVVLGGREFAVESHEVRSYFKLREIAEKLKVEVREVVHQPGNALPFLQPGRLVNVQMMRDKVNLAFGWGCVVEVQERKLKEKISVEVLLRCRSGSNKNGVRAVPFTPMARLKGDTGRWKDEGVEEWMVVHCYLRDLHGMSALRILLSTDLRTTENRATVGRSVQEALRRFPDGPPMLDPIGDMAIKDKGLAVLLKKAEAVEEAMIASPVATCMRMTELALQWRQKQIAEEKVKEERRKLKEAKGLILAEDLKKMKRVLRRLGFINAQSIVEVKGRVACEVNTADELIITELLLGGNLNDMSAEVLVSLCSCFVLDEGKLDDKVKLEPELQGAFDALRAVATRVATVKDEAGLNINKDEYVEAFKPHAMRVVYFWMKGKRFSDVCEISDLFEGSVIRCFRRLEELLRQLVVAVKSIGNTELAAKIDAGSATLKRGIAFHSSLYI